MPGQKVVHIAESFGSGTFEVIRQLANHQIDLGWEVTILHGIRSETPDESSLAALFDARIKRVVLPLKGQINPLYDLLALIKLVSWLRSEKPDIIHLHSSKAGLLGRIAARLLGQERRVLYTPHGWSFMRQDVSPIQLRIFVLLERLGTYFGGTILACSTSEAELARSVLNTPHVKLLRNGIALPPTPARAQTDTCLRVATVGRLVAQKAPWRIAALAQALGSEHVLFRWIGGGSQEAYQQWLSGSSIRLTGLLPRAEVAERLRQIDVFLLLSEWEGLPLALIEAQGMGIPAIVSNIPGCTEVIQHGYNGFVAESDADALRYLRQLLSDQTLRQTMGAAAAKRVQALFSPTRFLENADQVYTDLLKALP